jgi:uncharacterized protein
MGFRLSLRNTDFTALFRKQSEAAVRAATYFVEIVSMGVYGEEAVEKMLMIEHEADDITHEIIKILNNTIFTDYDREDIFALTKSFDSVVDMIYTITNRLKVYRIREINPGLLEFSYVIKKSVEALSAAVKGLENMKDHRLIIDFCAEVNRLEHIGDTLLDNNLEKLFESNKDPFYIIKWKEIFQFAEEVLDICEDVSNVVETIIVKQS